MVMFPLVAVLVSVLFEGLELSRSIVAGMLLVLSGNVFILRGRGAAAKIIHSQADREQPLSLATERQH